MFVGINQGFTLQPLVNSVTEFRTPIIFMWTWEESGFESNFTVIIKNLQATFKTAIPMEKFSGIPWEHFAEVYTKQVLLHGEKEKKIHYIDSGKVNASLTIYP